MPKKRPVPVSSMKALPMNGDEAARAEGAQAERRREASERGETARAASGAAFGEVHLLLIVDASGSMAPYQEIVRQGLRGFLARLGPAIPYRITLAQFENAVRALCVNEPISAMVAQRAVADYRAWGGTSLWDGIVDALGFEEGPSPTLCLIASDGEDVSSRLTAEDARRAIEERRALGTWTFLWLNMTGRPLAQPESLGVETMDLRREDLSQTLAAIAARLGRAVERMRLEGAPRIPDLLRLE